MTYSFYKWPASDWDKYPIGKPDSTETYEVTSIPEEKTPMSEESQYEATDTLFKAYKLNEAGVRKVNLIALAFQDFYEDLAQIIGIESPNFYGVNPNLIEVAQLRLRLQEAKMWATRAASVLPENQQ
jgi:hypothetical protein